MAMSDFPRGLHEDTSNHHGYDQEEDDDNAVYTMSRPLRHESAQGGVEEPPVAEVETKQEEEKEPNKEQTPEGKLPGDGTDSPEDAASEKAMATSDGSTTTPLNVEAALSETGEGKEKEAEKETGAKKDGAEKEASPEKGADKEAPAKEEAPLEITALGEGGELKLPEAELEPGSEENAKKELAPVGTGPIPPPPGDGEKLPGAEDGGRLTDMKVPALDGGPERMKLQDDAILAQTKESMKTFALESKTKEEQKITNLSKNEQKKENASTKLGKSKSAVEEKPSEKQSEVNSKQVTKVAEVKPPEVKKDEAQSKLHDTLNKSMPQTLEAVDEFKEKKVATDISAHVEGAVDGKTKEIDGTFSQIEKTEKPEDPKKGKPLGGIDAPTTTEGMNLGDNLVEPVKEDAVNLTAYKEESDNVLKREGISEEQLAQVTTGDLAEANKLRTDLHQKADKGPADIRKEEEKLKEKNKAELNKEEQDKKAKMRKERENGLRGSLEKQKGTKTAFERKKELVTGHINKIYEDANTKVKTRLDGLKVTAMAQFDGFQTMATAAFENNVDRRIEEFKKERYDTVGGSFLWVKDKLFGIDDFPQVQEILRSERETYINSIDKAIVYITDSSQKTIQETKTILADARKEIDKYVKSLGPELQKIGREAQGDIQKKLDELDEKINKAAEELKESLAKKREEAIASIDKKIEEKRAEMSGGLAKMGGLLADAALKFFKWAVETAGYSMDDIMPILNKGKAVLTKIVTEPGQFFSDLGAGVGGGISAFVDNAGTHLKNGLFDWLTGAMSGIPIVLPEKWDLGGIFSFISQILGFGWETIKTKFGMAAGIDSEKMSQVESSIAAGEEGMEKVKKVKEEGLSGAMEIIQDQVDEAKETAISEISNWAIMAIVKAAIPRVIAMLNPAGAIAQLIMAMVKAIIWFKDNFQRIAKWVKTVFDSVVDIAGGAIGAAAQKVEQSMAQAIPLILAFLAEQLGLSGIGKAIQEVMEKIRKPVDKIVDKIVAWIVDKAKRLIAKVKKMLGKDKPADSNARANANTNDPAAEGPDKRTSHEKQKDLNTAVKEATAYLKEGGAKDRKDINKKLKQFESVYNVKDLSLIVDNNNERGLDMVHIHGSLNTQKDGDKVEVELNDNADRDDSTVEIAPERFEVGEEHHKLYINSSGEIIVESDPERLDSAITKYTTSRNASQALSARRYATLLKGKWNELATKETKAEKDLIKKDAEKLESKIAEILKVMMFGASVNKDKIKPTTIRFDVKDLPEDEFNRQLKLQQKEIRTINVGEWQTRRAKYTAFGRSSKDTKQERRKAVIENLLKNPVKAFEALKEQNILPKKYNNQIRKILDSSAKQEDKAEELYEYAELIMKRYNEQDLDVLHTLDQIAGGDPTKYGDGKTIFGSSEVNQAIGGQWILVEPGKTKERIEELDEAVKGVNPNVLMKEVTLTYS